MDKTYIWSLLIGVAFAAGYGFAVWEFNREIERVEPEIAATVEAHFSEATEELEGSLEELEITIENRIQLDGAFLRGYRCLVNSADNPTRWDKIAAVLNRGNSNLRSFNGDSANSFGFVAQALNNELDSLNCLGSVGEDGDMTRSPSRLITEETGE